MVVGAILGGISTFISGQLGQALLSGLASSLLGTILSTGIKLIFFKQPNKPVPPDKLSNYTQPVSPATYIFGYARVTPPMFFVNTRHATDEDDDTLDIVLGISEGSIEDVTAIWANNRVVTATREYGRTDAHGRYVDFIGVIDYNGTFRARIYLDCHTEAICKENGERLRAAQSEWGYDQALPITWAHIELTPRPDRGEHAGWIRGIPKIEMLVQGKRITWPGQSNPTWTRNAAAVRYWFETELRGRTVEDNTFRAAYDICNEILDPTVDAEGEIYESDPPIEHIRYAADGFIFSNENLDQIGDELDETYQGLTIFRNGAWTLLPGSTRAVSATLDHTDVIEVELAQLGPAANVRYNQIAADALQSSTSAWLKASLPDYTEVAHLNLDGLPLVFRYGTRRFTADLYQFGRMMVTALRRRRVDGIYNVRCLPGERLKNLAIHPGDIVDFTHPTFGAIRKRCLVVSSTISPDVSVNLSLIEEPENTYEVINHLPTRPSEHLTIGVIAAPGGIPNVPTGFAVYARQRKTMELNPRVLGTEYRMRWDNNENVSRWQWQGEGRSETHESETNSAETEELDYALRYRVRALNTSGQTSRWTQWTAPGDGVLPISTPTHTRAPGSTPTYTHTPTHTDSSRLPAPTGLTVRSAALRVGTQWTLNWDAVPGAWTYTVQSRSGHSATVSTPGAIVDTGAGTPSPPQ